MNFGLAVAVAAVIAPETLGEADGTSAGRAAARSAVLETALPAGRQSISAATASDRIGGMRRRTFYFVFQKH